LHKIDSMAEIKPQGSSTSSTTTTTQTTTRLPGVDSTQVIPSRPNMVKENSPNITIKKK